MKHTSNLQGATGLNVSECEYYALTHGAAHGLGLKAYVADPGFEMSLQMFSDSSAARAFASRRGLGRQRHVQTRYLWLQERVAAAHLTVHHHGIFEGFQGFHSGQSSTAAAEHIVDIPGPHGGPQSCIASSRSCWGSSSRCFLALFPTGKSAKIPRIQGSELGAESSSWTP